MHRIASLLEKHPVNEPITGRETEMVMNNAGGVVFTVDCWTRLNRWLILGSEGGSYYVSEKKLTLDSIKCLDECLKADGERTVKQIAEVSHAGRAPRNDQAIFALIYAAKKGDDKTRAAAWSAFPEVVRTGTHLFQAADAVKACGGWGRATKRAFQRWYLTRNISSLAYQVVKYQSRKVGGTTPWTHRDILRLCKPRPGEGIEYSKAYPEGFREADCELSDVKERVRSNLFAWVAGKDANLSTEQMRLIQSFEEAKTADLENTVELIRKDRLTREMVRTELLNEPAVWEALLERMPMTALLRNVATMTRIGAKDAEAWMRMRVGIVAALRNQEAITKSRLHPLSILMGLKTYESGKGMRGQNTWSPDDQIVHAMNRAFYKSFGNVEPSGKRLFLGLDVSGSMSCGVVAGMRGITPREASAAMALIQSATDKCHHVYGFTAGTLWDREIHNEMGKLEFGVSLPECMEAVSTGNAGGTDISLPFRFARLQKIEVDCFVVYTDNETWRGEHASEELKRYREEMGIDARSVVVAMAGNEFTVADPSDPLMLDVAGFDTSTPAIINAFARGEL